MLTKYAFFTGNIKRGMEAGLKQHVEETLQPLWEQFQPSIEVRVLYNHTTEPDGPNIPLVLAVTYENEAALETAMACSARHEAKALLPAFYDEFFDDIKLWHYTFEHE